MSDNGNNMFRAIDLFCGAGGFSLGLQRAGFRIVLAADSWKTAVESYRANFRHLVLQTDLSDASAQSLLEMTGGEEQYAHLLVGGPPCQGFSVQRIGAQEDVRNNLVLSFARLVGQFQPRLFIMENVPGLRGKKVKDLLKKFEKDVGDAGYSLSHVVINSAEYGVPQIRKRLFYYGWQSHLPEFHFPNETHQFSNFLTAKDAIGDLPSPPSILGHEVVTGSKKNDRIIPFISLASFGYIIFPDKNKGFYELVDETMGIVFATQPNIVSDL